MAPDKSAAGLNYFFHDELLFGVGDRIWVDDFAEVFRKCKGCDVFDILPALFTDIGPMTPKALHRKIGSRDVYMVMGAAKESEW